jgi:hypothetical protein
MSVEGVSRAHIESAFDELMSVAGNVNDFDELTEVE